MGKVIQYKPDASRKLGFKRVRKGPANTLPGQLDLFADQPKVNKPITQLKHLDPFEKALSLDDRNDAFAEKLYLEAIKQQVSTADAYCNLGIIYARQGATAQAIDHFTLALKENPRHTESHYNLANMYYDAQNYALAAIHYELALKMEDRFPEIAYNLALTHICLDQKPKAIEHLTAFIYLTPEEQHQEALHLLQMLKATDG